MYSYTHCTEHNSLNFKTMQNCVLSTQMRNTLHVYEFQRPDQKSSLNNSSDECPVSIYVYTIYN